MKKAILIFAILLIQTVFLRAQEDDVAQELNWIESYSDAKEKALTENKSILIFFTGSDWCGLCKMLDKDFFATDKFKEIATKNLILYKADFPRRTDLISVESKEVNEKLSAKYSKSRSKRSFPTLVLTDAQGNEIGFIESYNYIHDTSNHYGLLKEVMK